MASNFAKHMKALLWFAWLAMASGCVTSSSLRRDFNQGKRAYATGRVLDSYRILKGMDLSGKVPPKEYFKVVDEVTRAAEYLLSQWFDEAARSQDEGDLLRALSYYEDLLKALPEEDPLRQKVEQRAEPVRKQLDHVQKQVQDMVAEAQVNFASGEIEEARLNLIRAREQSYRNRMEFPLDYERLLAECDRRLPAPVVELSEIEAPDEGDLAKVADSDAKKTGIKAIRRPPRRRPRPRHRQVSRKEAEVSEGEKSSVEASRSDVRIVTLLKKAQQLLKNQNWTEAIITYRNILKLEPNQPDAKEALRQLKPRRDKLIAEWMKQAGEFFAKEQLGKAAPLYRRVLQLDPSNLRAKEGLQMYQRLKEIKSKQK